jgi:hypothetical protein
MVAMFVAGEAQEAKIEVGAVLAGHKFMLRQFSYAGVTSSLSN